MAFPRPPIPAEGRLARGARLLSQLNAANAANQQTANALGIGVPHGIYLQFESVPGWELNVQSLESKTAGIEVISVMAEKPANGDVVYRATVYVPEGKLGHFMERLNAYVLATPKKERERRYEDMLDRVQEIRRASLKALWTDSADAYPVDDALTWWELWLRRSPDGRELAVLNGIASQLGIEIGSESLSFFDRTVVNVKCTATQMASSLQVFDYLAELRLAKVSTAPFAEMQGAEQANWLEELLGRTTPAPKGAPTVCILDTGVNRGHRLLGHSIGPEDVHTHLVAWGTNDQVGHGTQMAGLALYGDLTPVLASREQVLLRHRIESVKILPPPGHAPNDPRLYGAITAACVDRVQSTAPGRIRVHSMSVMADDTRDLGQPTSWSASIDALAAGRSFDSHASGLTYLGDQAERRLFVLSAGNVDADALSPAHLEVSDTSAIHDPGQAWNAITVGAHTDKATVSDATYRNHQPMAQPGELSPWSSTSLLFKSTWPIKPDVVFEGGNLLHDGANNNEIAPDCCVLTTHPQPVIRSFLECHGTSAAAAQVARIAAMVHAEYPALWPETVRALVVHSAVWTPAMWRHFNAAGLRRQRQNLARRYGFGVPSVGRALRSASDSLVLLAQATIKPFQKGKLREIHFHQLPWPKDVLRALGEKAVTLRVTLSYFVEPNPARRGWKKRHSYASHGLRFDVKGRGQSVEQFQKRLNQLAIDEEEERPPVADDASQWFFGAQDKDGRHKGSLHGDFIFNASGADLAERGMIGVFPVSGWWKEQPKHDRSDHGVSYALVVSLETAEQGVDLWTPVATEVGLPVAVTV